MITWVYDDTGFNPAAKLVGNKSYSVINDYLGTPLQAYDEKGNLVWERELDIYGKTRKETKENYNFVPFLYQGQYLDSETDLCYNRFRYYDPNAGNYISQDPIGLAGGNPTLYGYVHDSNTQVDPLGLVPWDTGAFGDWFDSASIQDIINNKEAVSDALRGSGGMHEKFPVSMASKAKELGFTYSELMDMTVERSKVWFENVADRFGNIHSGPHSTGAKLPEGQSGKASSWFHKNLMEDLDGAKTKQEALDIINKHHNAHMKYK